MNNSIKPIDHPDRQIAEGPVVAVQYPATVNYVNDEKKAVALKEKYSHLTRIDVDDKAAYKELTAAIADVRTHRTDNQKQEDNIKKPLNAFRALVISTGKKLREKFADVEQPLIDEKQRIDDIKAHRLEAQRKLWNENLLTVRHLAIDAFGLSLEQMQAVKSGVYSFDLASLDFGDLLPNAEDALLAAKNRIDASIKAETSRVEFAKEQARIKAAQELEAARLKAESDRIAKEKADADAKTKAAEDEAASLRAKIAEMEAAAKPVEPKIIGFDRAQGRDSSHQLTMENGATISFGEAEEPMHSLAPEVFASEQVVDMQRESIGFDDDPCPAPMRGLRNEIQQEHCEIPDPAPAPAPQGISEGDKINLESLIRTLAMAQSAPLAFNDQAISSDVQRVQANLGQAVAFLQKHISQ